MVRFHQILDDDSGITSEKEEISSQKETFLPKKMTEKKVPGPGLKYFKSVFEQNHAKQKINRLATVMKVCFITPNLDCS